MDNRFDSYLKTLAGVYREGGTEHTGRTPLENLLNVFAGETMDRGAEVQHEGGREGDKGAPDYKIKRRGMILLYLCGPARARISLSLCRVPAHRLSAHTFP